MDRDHVSRYTLIRPECKHRQLHRVMGMLMDQPTPSYGMPDQTLPLGIVGPHVAGTGDGVDLAGTDSRGVRMVLIRGCTWLKLNGQSVGITSLRGMHRLHLHAQTAGLHPALIL